LLHTVAVGRDLEGEGCFQLEALPFMACLLGHWHSLLKCGVHLLTTLFLHALALRDQDRLVEARAILSRAPE